MTTENWVTVADADDLEMEDVIEADVDGKSLAVYKTKSGYFASDGICTHEYAKLCEGFVFGNVIECPKHQGRFDVRTGATKGAPVIEVLATYPVRVVGAAIQVNLPSAS